MLTNAQVKHLQGLKLKKYRQKYAEFIIEGDKLITEALLENAGLKLICAEKQWIRLHQHAIPSNCMVEEVTEKQLEKISGFTTPQQVIAVVPFFPHIPNKVVYQNTWTIVLDGISDPGNFGTIIRSADWFGLHTIICSENCVELYNPKVIQASMGSLFRVKVMYTNIASILSGASVKKYASVLRGKNFDQIKFGKEGIIVIGSESHGISDELLKLCDEFITIPGKGRAESLNAGVAASILFSRISNE